MTEANTAQRISPSNYFIRRHRALILAAQGDLAGGLKAIDDAQAQLGGVPEDWMTVRGYILGRMGRRTEAQQLLRDYTKLGASEQNIAVILLGMGDLEAALDHLERALAVNPSLLAHLIPQSFARVLDGNPRFETIRRNLGIQ